MLDFLRSPKIKRTKEILQTFFKYGLDYLVDRSRIGFLLKLRGRAEKLQQLSAAERLRLALEELGPTFIKFGQILSTRPDLVPPHFIDELEKLQDQVKSFDASTAKDILREELNQPLEEIFNEFQSEPIAAASLSQVHKARLQSGEEVAVKIRRPGIADQIKLDISILEDIAGSLENRMHQGWVYHPKLMVEEFKQTILDEIDFTNEAHNYRKFSENLAELEYAHVPYVHWDYVTDKVIVMEFMEGVKVSEVSGEKYDKRKIARRGSEIVLKQIYEDGFFHGDPHPANLFVQPPADIVLLDVGMVGHLDEYTRQEAAKLLQGVAESDPTQCISSLKKLGAVRGEYDEHELYGDLNDLFNKYIDIPLKKLDFKQMNKDFLRVMVRHNMTLPPNLSLMIKAVITIESIGKQLDPEFNMAENIKPFLRDLLSEDLSLDEVFNRGKNIVKDSSQLAEQMPGDLMDILEQLRTGKLRMEIEHKGLDDLDYEIDRSSNQLSFSIIIAAIIVGSSLIIQQGVGPFVLGYSALGVAGFVVATVLGMVLIISIIGSGRWR